MTNIQMAEPTTIPTTKPDTETIPSTRPSRPDNDPWSVPRPKVSPEPKA